MDREYADISISEEEESLRNAEVPLLKRQIPAFELKTLHGETVRSWDYKERKNLMVLLFDPRKNRDWEILAELRHRYDDISRANGEVLAVAGGPIEELADCVEDHGSAVQGAARPRQ